MVKSKFPCRTVGGHLRILEASSFRVTRNDGCANEQLFVSLYLLVLLLAYLLMLLSLLTVVRAAIWDISSYRYAM